MKGKTVLAINLLQISSAFAFSSHKALNTLQSGITSRTSSRTVVTASLDDLERRILSELSPSVPLENTPEVGLNLIKDVTSSQDSLSSSINSFGESLTNNLDESFLGVTLRLVRDAIFSITFDTPKSGILESFQIEIIKVISRIDEFLAGGSTTEPSAFATFMDQLNDLSQKMIDAVGHQIPGLAAIVKSLPSDVPYPAIAAVVSVGVVGVGMVSTNSDERIEELPTSYDPVKLELYFNQRPLELWKRVAVVVAELLQCGLPIYLDRLQGQGDDEELAKKRAARVTEGVSKLGAAYIKVGQACSIRPDLFPEVYLSELQKLQDQVPAFGADEVKASLKKELGVDPADVFVDPSVFEKEPIAAASLGQVYRATLLATGQDVAVKVQRPGMLQSVSLDLLVIRKLLNFGARVPQVKETCESLVGVIDAWAARFLDELDYEQEAKNAADFAKRMADTQPTVRYATTTPEVFLDLTSRYVMTSEWVEGQRLSSIDTDTPEGKEAVLTVINILLNSYLTQLLETGLLHADPHPGNFLLTPDGRLCILDYGLMTEIPEDRRLALIEYVAHLNGKEYEETLGDLVTLGFIPKEIQDDPEKRNIVAPLLANVLEQLSNGGGAKAVTVETVGEEVEELGRQYPITIPAYFGLIVRAFSTLEGIALLADPQFSIVNACFPYLARRLLTDDSPRVRKMLKSWLYGKEDRLSVERIDELVDGYRQFTLLQDQAANPSEESLPVWAQSMPAMAEGQDSAKPLPDRMRMGQVKLDAAAVDALQLLFNKEGNYVQDLVVEELVRVTDAVTRQGANTGLALLRQIAGQGDSALPARTLLPSVLSALFLLRSDPVVRFAERMEQIIALTEDDKETLETTRRLVDLLRQGTGSSSSELPPLLPRPPGIPPLLPISLLTSINPREAAAVARDVLPVVRKLAPGVRSLGTRYIRQLANRALQRLADDIAPTTPSPSTKGSSQK
uniref:Protein kinase domain-containing protein n=1 Tax=Fibrocapsa japonica TaxID=94617 RepID=A0A7S2V6P2_9STRA|mmetsp:Transcript_8989/g.13841  ORF Transcript_8989/g.13841 Transcript_8989/m.13841 type:complete len:963 (+) Transcript_8989:120-3008(+)